LIEDAILIWRFKKGSSDALAGIYEKYRDDLLRIAISLLNQTSAAEDIVHDVFIGFVRGRHSFRLTGSLKGYLVKCVINRVRNFNKSKAQIGNFEFDDFDQVETRREMPERWIIENEESSILNDALAGLPYEQREVVVMHTLGNMRFRQIADLQDISTKTVQSRYRYGIEKLRSFLNGKVTI
jgi:RNA polymerase sigma-70 factor (ECF subfamily)